VVLGEPDDQRQPEAAPAQGGLHVETDPRARLARDAHEDAVAEDEVGEEALLRIAGVADAVLERGEIVPELLTGDEALAARIRQHPQLLWKVKHVREHRKLTPG